tara:strand:- start:118 stop:534 length:417 start_codon:yes stop_codon:yes gene_type:complete
MDHMNLSDELRKQLLESAAWGKAGIVLSEGIVDEAKKAVDDDEEARTGKKAKKGENPFAKGKKKDEKEEVQCEETVHVCPLCVSQLEESIDEERLLEHLNVVVGLVDRLSQLQEGDEDIDTVIDETIAELLYHDTDEE